MLRPKARKRFKPAVINVRLLYVFAATCLVVLRHYLLHYIKEADVINTIPTRTDETGASTAVSSKSILDCNGVVNADHPTYRDNPQVIFRKTNTRPPFYISLHNYTIDHVRWATIMGKGYYYETSMYDALHESLKDFKDNPQEAIVLDVGGNIGWFTLIAASLGHRVITFEPNNINNVKLCESLQMNGLLHEDKNLDLVEIYEAGVGDNHGEVLDLYHFPAKRNPGKATFVESLKGHGIKVGSMSLLSLDQIAEEKGWFKSRPNIAFLKVDVEGFELNVLRGASKMIKAKLVNNMVFEFKPHIATEKEKNLVLLQALIDSGYVLYKWGNSNGPGNLFTQKFNSTVDLFNIIGERGVNKNLWWTVGASKQSV